jgi:hypothetical protein
VWPVVASSAVLGSLDFCPLDESLLEKCAACFTLTELLFLWHLLILLIYVLGQPTDQPEIMY